MASHIIVAIPSVISDKILLPPALKAHTLTMFDRNPRLMPRIKNTVLSFAFMPTI
jgi:hypothetical protein